LDVLANHDPVLPKTRGAHRLKLGERDFERGLYCHAISRVLVRLPAPGKRFTAVVGLDRNDDTMRGKGSVIFSVTVRDAVAFKSDVMRVDSAARAVDLDLAGATAFTLEIDDSGDGISWDQSDWADARVLLRDGRDLWLDDLPIRDLRPEFASAPLARSSELPFGFVCGGRSSDALLAGCARTLDSERLDAARTRHTVRWCDPKMGLETRCVAVEYADFPVVEWTVHLTNKGPQNLPLLENLQGLDARLESGGDGKFRLRHWNGDTCKPDLYQPFERALPSGDPVRFAPVGGRGSNGTFPYFNLDASEGGWLLAVGWPGQWATAFVRETPDSVRVTAGQEFTRLILRPGEEIRTPLMVLLFWQGTDTIRAQNLWRRWMWEHNVPRTADGQLPPPILFGNTSGEFNEMCNANDANQKLFIDRYAEERVGIDYWWMDAGWYPCGGKWPNTGTWAPDLSRFPGGLRSISDHAHARGVKTLVWFEPERVSEGSWLAINHPDWLLDGKLLNLGNPEARAWLTDHVDRLLREQGIDLYRQDFNMDPLRYWRRNDGANRQGMTENLHVQGYLAYWDALRARHPQLIIDSCASGGRRNDLETLRRAVPLHPTDYNYADLTSKQAFHHSLHQWIPYFGSNTVPMDQPTPLAVRSGHGLAMIFGYDLRRPDLDTETLRRLTAEWRRSVRSYYGDFFPLTPYNRDDDKWIAWQFHRDGPDGGIVEAFRRSRCDRPMETLRLRGLDAARMYEIGTTDGESTETRSGSELMEKGLRVEIQTAPGAAVIVYSPVRR